MAGTFWISNFGLAMISAPGFGRLFNCARVISGFLRHWRGASVYATIPAIVLKSNRQVPFTLGGRIAQIMTGESPNLGATLCASNAYKQLTLRMGKDG